MAMIVDVHAHLDHASFDMDRDEVIKRAVDAGVKAINTNGLNPETNRKTLELSRKYDIVKAAIGIYPPDALRKEVEHSDNPLDAEMFDVSKEIEFIRKNAENIIAIGECGLDFTASNEQEKEEQKDVFRKMIALAEELNKPIVVHSRKAEKDVIDILSESGIKKVLLHCFCGKKGLVKQGADLGYYFSIPCNVVRAQNFQQIVEKVNINQLLTETDSPFLSPFRDKRNEPSFITESIKKIAEIKEMDIDEVEKNIYMNYQKLF